MPKAFKMSGLRASISISNYGIVPKTISYTKKAFFPHIIKDDKPYLKISIPENKLLSALNSSEPVKKVKSQKKIFLKRE